MPVQEYSYARELDTRKLHIASEVESTLATTAGKGSGLMVGLVSRGVETEATAVD
jgi:hypothetical protein